MPVNKVLIPAFLNEMPNGFQVCLFHTKLSTLRRESAFGKGVHSQNRRCTRERGGPFSKEKHTRERGALRKREVHSAIRKGKHIRSEGMHVMTYVRLIYLTYTSSQHVMMPSGS